MAHYLVTGAAGFIGWRTSEMLLAEGHTVVGLDSLNTYYDVRVKRWRLAQLEAHDHFSFVAADLAEKAALEQVLADNSFDAVIHLAAQAGVRHSWIAPADFQQANAVGLVNMLRAMESSSTRKLVLASTSSLYAGQPLPWREINDVSRPATPYAASKLAAEALAWTWHLQYGFDVSVVRYFTVYGPAGRPDMAPFRFVEAVLRGSPLPLFGDGSQSRDFTFVDDIARGTMAALQPVGYEVFNLGGGKEPAVIKDVISLIEGLSGETANIERHPLPAGDFRTSQADVSKAKAQLGWEPQVGLEEGFRQTVAWHQEQRSWLQGLDGPSL